jgi:hypothetical protein
MGYEQASKVNQIISSEQNIDLKTFSRSLLQTEAQLTLLGPTPVAFKSKAYSEYLLVRSAEIASLAYEDSTLEVNPLQERLEF